MSVAAHEAQPCGCSHAVLFTVPFVKGQAVPPPEAGVDTTYVDVTTPGPVLHVALQSCVITQSPVQLTACAEQVPLTLQLPLAVHSAW
jgi:hypothetical protein